MGTSPRTPTWHAQGTWKSFASNFSSDWSRYGYCWSLVHVKFFACGVLPAISWQPCALCLESVWWEGTPRHKCQHENSANEQLLMLDCVYRHPFSAKGTTIETSLV